MERGALHHKTGDAMVRGVESRGEDWSWQVEVAYACACGAICPVTRWLWVDASSQPQRAQRVHQHGPFDGTCAACQKPCRALAPWLEITPAREQARLIVPDNHRGDVLGVLQTHLDQLRQRIVHIRPWLLQPTLAFVSGSAPATAPVKKDDVAATTSPEPEAPRPEPRRASGSSEASMVIKIQPAAPLASTAPPRPPSKPVPAAASSTAATRALVGTLALTNGVVSVQADLDTASLRMWSSGPVDVRPVLLRGLGYPLLGVRMVTEYNGEMAVLDGVADVGEPTTTEVFVHLSQAFRVALIVAGATVREFEADALQRNAAMCLESAQGQLGAGEFPADAFRSARDALARMTSRQRLEPARHGLGEIKTHGLASAGAVLRALERLDAASRKDNLARLLEVDGMAVGGYESLRKQVLTAAIEFGLVAPARFWRRVLGTDLARDPGEWIQRLVHRRRAALSRGDDLSEDQAEQAWRGIFDLCQHHDITPPPEVIQALGLGRRNDTRDARAPNQEARPSAPPRPGSRVPTGPQPALQPPRQPTGSHPALPPRQPTGPHAVIPPQPSGPRKAAVVVHPAEPPTRLPRPRRSDQPPVAMSGSIDDTTPPEPPLLASEVSGDGDSDGPQGSEDPRQVAEVLALLQGPRPGEALSHLDRLGEDSLLAVLPAIAELGMVVVPGLVSLLTAPRRVLRQSAAILLGMSRDRRAIGPLTTALGHESTAAWLDVAAALGNFGPRVVSPLCSLLHGTTGTQRDQVSRRVTRALAELVAADGDAPGGAGRLTVESLLEVTDPAVSSAARQALDTLAQVRGQRSHSRFDEASSAEDRKVRSFSARAHEAITTPELDADGDFEVVGED